MGWFDEQIEYRKRREQELLSDAFQNIARSVTGHKVGDVRMLEGADVKDATSQLLKYYHIKEKEMAEEIPDLEDRLDYLLSSTGILYREVKLEKGWHRDAMGAMITTLKEDASVIAVLPAHSGHYYYIDPHSGDRIKVTGRIEDKIGQEAWCFYRPLPMRKLSLSDLARFMLENLTGWDIISFAIAGLVVTCMGLLIPKLTQILMGPVVKYGSKELLLAVMAFLLCATLGNLIFQTIRELLLNRIQTKISVNVTAASMMRVLSLPADFFKEYSAGELNEYLGYLSNLCDNLVDTFLSTALTGIFSLVYLFAIFQYARSLVIPSLLVTILTLAVSLIAAAIQTRVNQELMELSAKEKGMTFSLISGIRKIRLAGAENRAFSRWANLYAREAALAYNPPAFIKLNKVITTAISLFGTIIIYYVAVKNQVSVADYYAFNASYAYINSAFTAMASVALIIATIKPSMQLIKPLLQAEPEMEGRRETITSLAGNVELSHVSFRYEEHGPLILDDISIQIPAGQYVAIVGKTGCGKSTIMRLLLGFEKPTLGSIFYDRKDQKRLDLRSLRKHIGTVMQDGKVFSGSIFENITISAPTLKLQDAWDAAEIAGLADDIRNMPMEMNTMIAEGAGGISGGQKQRLMIARAVAPKPKLLLLDEATSALDNITQKKVSDALDTMNCTRIVIAHRLSTIRHCNRILVLDGGKIIEDGNYEELIEANGFFAELVARQRVED